MTIAHAIMQTILYSTLAICGICLLAVLALFVVLELPWQKQAETEVPATSTHRKIVVSMRHSDDHVLPESLANDSVVFHSHIGEMQVIGDESDQAQPRKHIA